MDDLWQRGGVPQAPLVQIAEAAEFRAAFGLARREALWAIRALPDGPCRCSQWLPRVKREVVPKTAEPEDALRPMTAGGEGFVTLEDESGIANFIVWPQIFGAYRRILLGTSMLGVQVQVQREGEVTNLMGSG